MPDIVFLDIRMPVMSGPEMLKRMRREYGEDATEVVAVTASVFDHQRQGYLDMGFAAFLSKPIESNQIYACLAELLAQMLTRIGAQVETAENGAEGLEQVGQEMPDIVFLDIRMPVMDGPEMLRQMRRTYGQDATVVVAVTASVFDHQRQEYLDMGFAAFLSKPIEAGTIYACLSEQLGVKFDFADESNDAPDTADRGWTDVVLTSEVYEDLASAVDGHSITDLRKGLDRLKGDAPDLAAHLMDLAGQYDMVGIETILDEINPQ